MYVVIGTNFGENDQVPSLARVQAMMSSGGNEDRGKPVRCIDTLDAEKVIAAWPPVGGARAVPITEMLDGYLMGAVRDPTGWWLPDDVRPLKRTRSEVRASDETWYKFMSGV